MKIVWRLCDNWIWDLCFDSRIIFRSYSKYGRKIVHSNGAFFHPMFANCVDNKRCRPISFEFGKFFENPKMIVWTCWTQFWQPCWKFFWPKIFCSKSENNYETIYFFQKKCFLKKFSRTCGIQFWQPRRKFFAKSPKIFIKLLIFHKNIFPQIVPLVT